MEEYLHDQNEKKFLIEIRTIFNTLYYTIFFNITPAIYFGIKSHLYYKKNTNSRSLSSLLNINKYRCVLNVALTKVTTDTVHTHTIVIVADVARCALQCYYDKLDPAQGPLCKWCMGYLESPKNGLKVLKQAFLHFGVKFLAYSKNPKPKFMVPNTSLTSAL